MKKLFALLPFLALSVLPVISQDNVIDEVVWVVGDEPILRSDVEKQRLQAQYEGVKFSGDPYCVIPEQLAVQKLYLHQADLDSVVVNESDVIPDVDRNINRIIAQLGSKEKMEEYFGMPLSKIRETQRESARNQMIVRRVQSKLVDDITVTPAEVRQFYNTLPLDSIPVTPAEIEVEIITVEPKYEQTEIGAIKDRLREFTERVNRGDNFSTLAVMYSEDRNSAKVGGELGFMGKGELVPEFANVAFSLTDPKKVSKIVETEFGYHIIQLIEKRGDRINCRHILLKPKISASERNQSLLRLDSIADIIRNQKIRFEDAAQYYSFDKDTKNNGGLMVNTNTGTSRFTMEELPQEVGKMAYQMNVGEISKPFTMITSKEKEVCAIIRVKSKSKAHRASISEDFQQIQQIVMGKKRDKVLNEWILEKQKKTYVRIDDHWRNCEFKYPGWIK
ncbi:MAG: peptidylprolyl isomerase [Bacteroidales bacterium]|nr:peptidylprolyl isomerase [Bacteroidales bacterium]MDD4713222.1 peptidylprolyl isomerase [Bacteroidales bacterium]